MMTDADFVKLARAYQRSTNRMAADIVSIWEHGSTRPPISFDFCAGDFVVEVLPK